MSRPRHPAVPSPSKSTPNLASSAFHAVESLTSDPGRLAKRFQPASICQTVSPPPIRRSTTCREPAAIANVQLPSLGASVPSAKVMGYDPAPPCPTQGESDQRFRSGLPSDVWRIRQDGPDRRRHCSFFGRSLVRLVPTAGG
jgi:hypothetical protein